MTLQSYHVSVEREVGGNVIFCHDLLSLYFEYYV